MLKLIEKWSREASLLHLSQESRVVCSILAIWLGISRGTKGKTEEKG